MKRINKDDRSLSQMFQDGLNDIFSRENYRKFLSFLSNNPNYSYRNCLLILQQCPNATKVHGYNAWKEEKRYVKSKERSLRINALFNSKQYDENTDSDDEQGEEKKKYRKISVFDISQTAALQEVDNEPQIMLSKSATIAPTKSTTQEYSNDHAEIIDILRDFLPFTIEVANNTSSSNLNSLQSLLKEIVKYLHSYDCYDKELLEIEATSVAIIVCQYLGLDISDPGFSLIEQIINGKERKCLKKSLDSIQKTALYIIDSYDGVKEARQLGYNNSEYFLFTNTATARKLFYSNRILYRVFPGLGERLVTSNEQIHKNSGPYATFRSCWINTFEDSKAA